MNRIAQTWDMAATAIGEFIASTVTDYAKLSDRLHAAAIMGFVHAAEHGDASHLNTFFFGLRENDQNMLKAWLLKFASYVNHVNGEDKTVQWMGFRSTVGKKGEAIGLFVKPNTQAVRKGKFECQAMYEGEAYYDTPDKPGKEITLEVILAMLSKLNKQVEKREEKASETSKDGNVSIPEGLRALVKDVSAQAELALAVAKASAPAQVSAGTNTPQ